MAISSNISKYQYDCDNSTVTFAFPQKLITTDSLIVYLYDTTDGTQATLVETTDYTVTPDGGGLDNGATITTVATYSADFQLTLVRENAFLQDLDLVEGGEIPSDPLETAIDNCVMLAQQLEEAVSRVPKFPESEPSTTSTVLPTIFTRINRFLGFDAAGNFTAFEGTSETNIDVNELKLSILSALEGETEIDATDAPIVVAAPTDVTHALNQTAADLLYATLAQGATADAEKALRTTESALTAWTGSVTPALVAGTSYTVAVTGNVTTFAPTLATVGTCKITISNASTYTIADPSNSSRYSRGSAGIDDLSAKAKVELIVTRTGTDYIYSAIETVAIT